MYSQRIKNGIIYGDDNIPPTPNLNYGAVALEKILSHDPNGVALIDGAKGEQITFGEMARKIVNIASSLTKLGVKVGDVVAICSENRIEYLIATIAVFCCGGVVTFYNPAYTKDDLIHGLNISRPKYVFLSGEIYDTHFATMRHASIISRFILFDKIRSLHSHVLFKDLENSKIDINNYQPVKFQGQPRTAMILYSSGTTGMAKGVKLTHLNLIASSYQLRPITKNTIKFTVAPWSSTMGILCSLREILYGRTLAFLAKYEEDLFLQTIQKYKVGVLIIAPPLIVMLTKSELANKYDISSVEFIYSGGAPIDKESIEKVKQRYSNIKHVLQGYGMTEATGAITDDLEIAPKEGSVGRAALGIIIKISDPFTNKTLGPGEPGEVRIKGLTLFEGYVRKDMKNEFDEEGFYKTGDIAYYDEDGYFFIVDRIKELIKYKAWQVAPSELEGLILKHPAVKDVGVTGVPDELAGELPTAFVVKQPNSTVTEQDIIKHVANKVAPWKRLRGGVIFLNEIPKTPSGKILRRKLLSLLPKRSPLKLPASKL
ncbi:uncharacterized protein LOC116777513 [Danaus plexippus]|uniref:uncharacterized protein LOC116777513 n=1 Tax=Danaus plexippus TaxID=13037 RepID=UPI002AB11E3A|nr:uncharacterized protein LOC116777513 [Danaus plexippus]